MEEIKVNNNSSADITNNLRDVAREKKYISYDVVCNLKEIYIGGDTFKIEQFSINISEENNIEKKYEIIKKIEHKLRDKLNEVFLDYSIIKNILYAVRKNISDEKTISLEVNWEDINYTIQINKINNIKSREINSIDNKNRQISNFVESLIKEIFKENRKMLHIDNQIFFDYSKCRDLIHGLGKLITGYSPKVLITKRGLFLCITDKYQPIYMLNASDQLKETVKLCNSLQCGKYNYSNDKCIEKSKDFFVGKKVLFKLSNNLDICTITNLAYDINMLNSIIEFEYNQKKENMTIQAYYKKRYNYNIKDTDQPLFKTVCQDKIDCETKIRYILPETCYVIGYDSYKNDEKNSILKSLLYSPEDKFNIIKDGYKYLQRKYLQINNNTKLFVKDVNNKEISSIIGDMNKINENNVTDKNIKEIPNKEININLTKKKKDKTESILIMYEKSKKENKENMSKDNIDDKNIIVTNVYEKDTNVKENMTNIIKDNLEISIKNIYDTNINENVYSDDNNLVKSNINKQNIKNIEDKRKQIMTKENNKKNNINTKLSDKNNEMIVESIEKKAGKDNREQIFNNTNIEINNNIKNNKSNKFTIAKEKEKEKGLKLKGINLIDHNNNNTYIRNNKSIDNHFISSDNNFDEKVINISDNDDDSDGITEIIDIDEFCGVKTDKRINEVDNNINDINIHKKEKDIVFEINTNNNDSNTKRIVNNKEINFSEIINMNNNKTSENFNFQGNIDIKINNLISSETITKNNVNKTNNIQNNQNINNILNHYNTQNPIFKSSKNSENNNREEIEDKDIEINKGKLNMIYHNSSNKINKNKNNNLDLIHNKENIKKIKDNNKIKEINTENLILNKAENKSRKKRKRKKKLKYDYNTHNKLINNWRINISDNFLKVKAKNLGMPLINNKINYSIEMKLCNGEISNTITPLNNIYLTVYNCVLLDFVNSQNGGVSYLNYIRLNGKNFGLNIPDNNLIKNMNNFRLMKSENMPKILNNIFQNHQNHCILVIILLDESTKHLYISLKQYFCELGINSQIILFNKSYMKNHKSININNIFSNIARQIVSKVCGNLFQITFPKIIRSFPSALLGIDYKILSDGKVCFSLSMTYNRSFNKYYTDIKKGNISDKLIEFLIREACNCFYKKNKNTFCERFIIYIKDKKEINDFCNINTPISDIDEVRGKNQQKNNMNDINQINNYYNDNVLISEIINALQNIVPENKLMITIFLVNTKHEIKFFETSNSLYKNVRTGTVIDDYITEPHENNTFEFYLQSPDVLKTALSPVKFKCIYNDNNIFKINDYEEATYFNCFCYWGFYGPIRIPAVLKNAEVALEFKLNVIGDQHYVNTKLFEYPYFI